MTHHPHSQHSSHRAAHAASPDAARGPLPIIAGVTGHRDLRPEDVPTLEKLVRDTLREVVEQYPHSRLIVLSPLAEGSDRLFARVGLELGAHLMVPLPLPVDLYEQDFETTESRAEFRRLLSEAECSFELPLVQGNSEHGITEPGTQRNRQYAQVGAFIARHSQVFLALWDGVEGSADKAGGTSEIVRFRLQGAPSRYDTSTGPLSFANSGPVHHIVTPRAGEPAVPANPLTRHVLVPNKQTAESFDQLHQWMDEFNSDALKHREMLLRLEKGSQAQLLQVPEEAVQAQIQTLSQAARGTLMRYSIADTLALHFGGRTRAASRNLFFWVFVAALCFNLFHSLPHPHLPEHPELLDRLIAIPWLLLLFLGASLIGRRWIHGTFEEGDFQNKHQDYRALAEALRIQFFWQVAGVPENVVDHYLRKQRGALEWIRNALRAWDAESLALDTTQPLPAADRLDLVAKHWVTEQRNYYARKATREQATLEKEERRIALLVQISVALALLLAIVLTLPLIVPVHALEHVKHIVEEPWIHGLIMVVIVTLAVTAGLRHGYNQQMARSEHAKQFGRMAELFDSAARHLDGLLRGSEQQRATALLEELGQEALEENGDWVLLHRERPLEVPHSG